MVQDIFVTETVGMTGLSVRLIFIGCDLLSIVTTREALRKVSVEVRWRLRPHGKES
jgi:hypothetical protein